MNGMHYAVYFDASEIVRVLAEHNPSLVMSTCSEFSSGTCLHLAASNLSLEAGKVLVSVCLYLWICLLACAVVKEPVQQSLSEKC